MVQKQRQETTEQKGLDALSVNNPGGPPGFVEAFIPYFLPGGSNELEMKRRMGGCPACGEGRALRFENSSGSSFIGDPSSSTITCKRCGTCLEGEGMAFRIIESTPRFDGRKFTQDETKALAAAHRDGDHELIQELLEDNNESDSRTFTAGGVISWIVGLFTVLTGLHSLSLGNAAAMLFILPAGLFVLPPTRTMIESKTGIEFTRGVVILVYLILYAVGAMLYTYAMPA